MSAMRGRRRPGQTSRWSLALTRMGKILEGPGFCLKSSGVGADVSEVRGLWRGSPWEVSSLLVIPVGGSRG